MVKTREYSTYRVVTTTRLEALIHLAVHDNLKTFRKPIVLASVKCTLRSRTLSTINVIVCKS